MSQIISNYPIFEGSQVLTSTQLNQLSAYLDQQGRLTRSKLIGIGVVCGMQVQPFAEGLQITKGLGITSEGFLIQSGTFNATHYRPYSLPEGIDYKQFKDVDHAASLFELLTEIPTDNTGVKKLNNPANFLNDKFVLIFLEIFDKDLKSCLGNACDDRGKDRLLTLRRLVVSGTDLDKILPEPKSPDIRGPFLSALDLPEFYAQKPLFYPNNPESNEFKSFVKHYQQHISLALSKDFYKAILLSYKIFEPILSKEYGFSNPMESAVIQSKIDTISSLAQADPAEIQGIQYLWDFAKELLKAYSEFRASALELWYNCVTDSSLFPLHLMLGRAKTSSETHTQFLKYRHGFVQPPIFNQQKLLSETCIQRHRRIILLIEKLETELFKKGNTEKFPIKITPSVEKQGLLGDRALPYYYDIKSKGNLSSWFSLENSWVDPGNLQLVSTERADVQSYDNQSDVEATEAKNPIATPLFFDIESYPFLRIEGHLGKPLNSSLSFLNKLILQFNLPIHVEILHLGEAEGSELIEDCGWRDLQEEYAFQRYFMHGMILELKQLFDYVTEYAKETEGEDLISNEFYQKASEVLDLLREMAKVLPECLKDLKWTIFQNTYKKLLQLLIDFALLKSELLKEVKTNPEKEKELDFYNGILMRLSPILYRILDLFFFTKLQRIYTSYENHIQQLQQTNQFAQHLKKHNGLTHEAGVLKAGTFYLLHDPKQELIIGDFSLPYYCCDGAPCLDACGEQGFSLPPFARPDYAIAYTEKSIKLEIMLNDALVSGRTYDVLAVGSSSTQNGKVEKNPESTIFRYTSAPGFTGIDSFQYVLRDTKTNQSDQGKVSILVKGAQGCYSIEVLTRWGGNDPEQDPVREMLRIREIKVANDESNSLAVELLLTSLTDSKGFSTEEITGGPLGKSKVRLRLLKCLKIPTDGITFEQMEQAILDYQGRNCGALVTPECTSLAVSGSVKGVDGTALSKLKVSVIGSDITTLTDKSGNYKIQFPSPGQTLIFESEGFENQEVEICSQKEADVKMVPSVQPAKECYSLAIISSWEQNLIRDIATQRELSKASGNLTETIYQLLESLRDTHGFAALEFKKTPLNDLSTQKIILTSVGANLTKIKPEHYANAIEEYQGINCGGKKVKISRVPAEILSADEIKAILDSYKVSYLANSDKTVLAQAYKAAIPDLGLSEKALALLKKETLITILRENSISTSSADNKNILIRKILDK
jgi:hypothetical protein